MLYRHPPDSTPLSLHDALPILLAEQVPTRSFHLLEIRRPGLFTRMEPRVVVQAVDDLARALEPHRVAGRAGQVGGVLDRKSTRLNSSHMSISYAVFCLKKKKRT